jgi:hypothetical protein
MTHVGGVKGNPEIRIETSQIKSDMETEELESRKGSEGGVFMRRPGVLMRRPGVEIRRSKQQSFSFLLQSKRSYFQTNDYHSYLPDFP